MNYYNKDEANISYSKEQQKEFLRIIKKADDNQKLTDGEMTMLFLWKKHTEEPRFGFVKTYYAELEHKTFNQVKTAKTKKHFKKQHKKGDSENAR